MKSKILITGATGNLGKGVVNHLLSKISSDEIAVMVRDASKASELQAKGVDVRTGDYGTPASLSDAMKGIEKLLLISSSSLNDRYDQHKNVIDAAKTAGVKHIIYTGVTIKDMQSSPLKYFLTDHTKTEDYIKENGFTYTFMRNGLYAEVIPMFAGANVLESGIFFPSGNGKVAFVSRKDLAEATANVLASSGHENKTYELTGSAAHSFQDIGDQLSALSGKQIPFVSPEPSAFKETLKQYGLPEEIVNMSAGFAAAIKNNDFENTSGTLHSLLNREPASLKSYLKETFISEN